MDKISIIIPAYNVEKYIEKCLNSVIDQTYKNLEIILVDDGSTDNTGNICDEFEKKDERIKVIHKPNGGLSAARNSGIEIATGKYICFIDSDDFVTNDYCEVLYNTLINNNADVSAVAYREIRDDSIPILDADEKDKTVFDNKCIIYDGIDIMIQLLKWETFRNMAWNKLYPVEKLKQHLFLDGKAFEDIYFSYEMLSDVNRVVYINTPCYYYFRRNNSISLTCSEKNINDFLDVVIMKFKGIKERFPGIDKYNYYGVFESLISICIKYLSCDKKTEEINDKIEFIINELKEYSYKNEEDFLPMLSDFQKACLYLLRANKELLFVFLKARQSMMEE